MKNAANSFKQVWNWHKFVTGTWLVSCWLFSSVQFQQLLFHSSLNSDIAKTLLNSDTGAARVNKQSSVNSHPQSHHWSHCDWLCQKGSVSYPSFTTGFDERSYAGSCLWILKWSCHHMHDHVQHHSAYLIQDDVAYFSWLLGGSDPRELMLANAEVLDMSAVRKRKMQANNFRVHVLTYFLFVFRHLCCTCHLCSTPLSCVR